MTPDAVRDADPARLRLPNLVGLPIAVVTVDTSSFAPASLPIVADCRRAAPRPSCCTCRTMA